MAAVCPEGKDTTKSMLEEGMDPEESLRRTFTYHERTKHHPDRYARSLEYLDWATQPDPFRTYAGAPRVELPRIADSLTASYSDLYIPGRIPPTALSLNGIAALFELALGLSAWKEYRGTRWALRCNPSSGNLHPTEGYAILPSLPGIEAGVYHYVSRDHCLERRCSLEESPPLPSGAFVVGLSSIHWREAWKYGERAFRYCQHDAGHAIAALRYAAAVLGWSAILLECLSDADVASWLGIDQDADFASIDRGDREHPDTALLIHADTATPAIPTLPAEPFRLAVWSGIPNALSPSHVEWEIIDEVAEATLKPTTLLVPEPIPTRLPSLAPSSPLPAATLIRQRRSCLALDGQSSIAAETFYAMLDHLLPRPHVPPWDAVPWAPHLHLGLFVHRVRDVAPGLYLFERNEAVHDRIRAAGRKEFLWQRPRGCPDPLRLFLLAEGDFREISRAVSCHQQIASDGAFSLGMIADFGESIRARRAPWYRRLFWESGVLGQTLYLEAEAAGIRSTGIGCYFDDVFHRIMGFEGDHFQSLYHFTVGNPVEDPRLTTLPPYALLR